MLWCVDASLLLPVYQVLERRLRCPAGALDETFDLAPKTEAQNILNMLPSRWCANTQMAFATYAINSSCGLMEKRPPS
eukprot:2558460-Amphidinium_carterae.1